MKYKQNPFKYFLIVNTPCGVKERQVDVIKKHQHITFKN